VNVLVKAADSFVNSALAKVLQINKVARKLTRRSMGGGGGIRRERDGSGRGSDNVYDEPLLLTGDAMVQCDVGCFIVSHC
jgi:hypothetical protein